MDKILYKDSNGDLSCRSRDFYKIFPTLHAYEELDMTPDDIEKTLLAFSSFLMEMTGGRMSKTNYTVQAMVAEANDHFERVCNDCFDRQELAKVEEERDALKIDKLNLTAMVEQLENSYGQLQEINDRTFQSNLAMGEDLKVMKAERDALASIVKNLSACTFCKHVSKHVYDDPCNSCDEDHNYPEWEWKGV